MWTGQGNKRLYFIIQAINVLANPVSIANTSQHGKLQACTVGMNTAPSI